MKKTVVIFIDVFTIFKNNQVDIESFVTLLDEFKNLGNSECNNVVISFVVSKNINDNNIFTLCNILSSLKTLININGFYFGKILYKGDSFELINNKLEKIKYSRINVTENIIEYIKEIDNCESIKQIYVLDENVSLSTYFYGFNCVNLRRLKEGNIEIPLIVFEPSVFNLRLYDNKYYGDKNNFFISLSNKSGISGILDCINSYKENDLGKIKCLNKK